MVWTGATAARREDQMNLRRGKGWIEVALVIALAIGVPLIVLAQAARGAGGQAPAAGAAQGRDGGAPGRPGGAQGRGAADPNAGALYTPAPGAKDLRAVLFNWMWSMGM